MSRRDDAKKHGTPTFFINGVRHDGPFDLGTPRGAIEDEIDLEELRD
jgi:hypothetical protein